MVQRLVAGIHRFRSGVFARQRELFERLAKGQSPQTLFITCSDSRIDPNLITHTDPGDLFVIRNAGNLTPAYSGMTGGEVASVEFAVAGLGVRDIVVCGHSHCGAINGLLHPEYVSEMPAVRDWLKGAETTLRIVRTKYGHLHGAELLEAAVEENVLVQLENLQTHPAVAAALASDQLTLHAWVYDIASGEVFAFDEGESQFTPLGATRPPGGPLPARVSDVQSGDTPFHGLDR